MSAAALERQIRPIYESLDTGSNKSVIVTCNKLLKKHPKNDLIKALKALALVRLQKVEEALVLCDQVLASKTTEDLTLSAMMHVLRGLGRHNDMVIMFENAFKKQPANEDLGAQTFFANVRTGNWKSAQQIAAKMHKQFGADRYLYWSIMSAVLQANDPTTPPNMRSLLYKLAHRLLSSSSTPPHYSADRLYLHLTILRELGLFDEAYALLDTEVGTAICAISLSCNEIRRELWQLKGLWKEEGDRAQKCIEEKSDRNWLEFLSVLDGTFSYLAQSDDEVNKASCLEHVQRSRDVFTRIMEKDGNADRSGLLALLELEKRCRGNNLSQDPTRLVDLMKQYFSTVGTKTCCFEDLKPYLDLEGDDLKSWTTHLESLSFSCASLNELQQLINVHKLMRYNLSDAQLDVASELARAQLYSKAYFQGLPLGANLAETELQPADDLAILAVHAYVTAWKSSGDSSALFSAVALMEYALSKSQHSFRIRLILIRVYFLLGAPSLALDQYRLMDIKQVQNDTLSHFTLTRASTFSLAASGDITFSTECIESSQIYLANSQETAEYVVKAFTGEKYSQIPDFIAFEERLDNSLQRDVVKVEHVRMRLSHEQMNSDAIDMELVELKFIFDRYHHDNRDFDVLPNYQPKSLPSLNGQTLLFGRSAGAEWLSSFLKIYIRALQLASNLDDTVEEQIIIGDRPKQTLDASKLHWKERFLQRDEQDLKDLTLDEQSFLNFTIALADWLEPYHNHIRPSPDAVLAEVNRLSEKKTGVAVKPAEPPATNGHGAIKKSEECPPAKPAPPAVENFFLNMQTRFREAKEAQTSPEALHIATLAQEAYVLFMIQTARFKPSAVVKANKLGPVVQSTKAVRTTAADILREMAGALESVSKAEDTQERRKAFIDVCEPLVDDSQIGHDFVLGVAKRVMEARRRVVEGISKGMVNICTAHKGT